MKVIIAGSRTITDSCTVATAIFKSGFDVTEVVSGRAQGVDTLGEQWGHQTGRKISVFPANWKRDGKAAGPIRNAQMRDYADAAIIFIWANSRGSENMRLQMEKAGKPCFVVRDGILLNI